VLNELLDLELAESSSTTLKTEISALYIGSIAKVEEFAPLTAAELHHTTPLVLWCHAISPNHLALHDCFAYLITTTVIQRLVLWLIVVL